MKIVTVAAALSTITCLDDLHSPLHGGVVHLAAPGPGVVTPLVDADAQEEEVQEPRLDAAEELLPRARDAGLHPAAVLHPRQEHGPHLVSRHVAHTVRGEVATNKCRHLFVETRSKQQQCNNVFISYLMTNKYCLCLSSESSVVLMSTLAARLQQDSSVSPAWRQEAEV